MASAVPPRKSVDPIILHVDDHRDLASPRIFVEDGGFSDALTGKPVRLTEPRSVEDAILSGALGMGSFLTPFLYYFPRAEVRHLCQPPKARGTTDSAIVQGAEADTLLQPGAQRPTIQLRTRTNR